MDIAHDPIFSFDCDMVHYTYLRGATSLLSWDTRLVYANVDDERALFSIGAIVAEDRVCDNEYTIASVYFTVPDDVSKTEGSYKLQADNIDIRIVKDTSDQLVPVAITSVSGSLDITHIRYQFQGVGPNVESWRPHEWAGSFNLICQIQDETLSLKTIVIENGLFHLLEGGGSYDRWKDIIYNLRMTRMEQIYHRSSVE